MEITEERLRLEYVKLSDARYWEGNLKLHDIGVVIGSIKKHGFKDPPKFEPELNEGRGGLVEGNGRTEALTIMRDEGEAVPRGVIMDNEGEWLIPVLFGVDAESELAAQSYGVDHNTTTMGGDYDVADHLRNWDEGFVYQLIELQKAGVGTSTFDGEDIQRMLEWEIKDSPDLDKMLAEHEEINEFDFWPVLRERISPQAFQKIQRMMAKYGEDEFALSKLIEAMDENISG